MWKEMQASRIWTVARPDCIKMTFANRPTLGILLLSLLFFPYLNTSYINQNRSHYFHMEIYGTNSWEPEPQATMSN